MGAGGASYRPDHTEGLRTGNPPLPVQTPQYRGPTPSPTAPLHCTDPHPPHYRPYHTVALPYPPMFNCWCSVLGYDYGRGIYKIPEIATANWEHKYYLFVNGTCCNRTFKCLCQMREVTSTSL